MTVMQSGTGLRLAILGNKVDRVAATLPATTTTTYFTIAGGRVLLQALLGEVTTVVQTQACNLSWTSAPTVGTAVPICAVLNISALELGALLSVTGLFTDAMTGVAAGAGAVSGMARQVILPIGNLRLITSATNTGATKWSAFYVPIDDGASLVAA